MYLAINISTQEVLFKQTRNITGYSPEKLFYNEYTFNAVIAFDSKHSLLKHLDKYKLSIKAIIRILALPGNYNYYSKKTIKILNSLLANNKEAYIINGNIMLLEEFDVFFVSRDILLKEYDYFMLNEERIIIGPNESKKQLEQIGEYKCYLKTIR